MIFFIDEFVLKLREEFEYCIGFFCIVSFVSVFELCLNIYLMKL